MVQIVFQAISNDMTEHSNLLKIKNYPSYLTMLRRKQSLY